MINRCGSNYFPLDITYKYARHPTEAFDRQEERLRDEDEKLRGNLEEQLKVVCKPFGKNA